MDINFIIDSKGEERMGLKVKMYKKGKSVYFKEGIHKVKITAIELVDGKFGQQLKWTIQFLKGKNKGKTWSFWTPAEITPKNKTGRYIKKIVGKLKFKDGKFDVEKAIVGKVCNVAIEDASTVNDDGSPRSSISNVFGKKVTEEEEEEEDDDEEDDDDDSEDDDEDDDDDDDNDDDDEDDDDEDEDDDDDDDDDDDEDEDEDKKSKKKKKGKKGKKGKDKKKKGKKKGKGKKKKKDDDDDDDMEW